MIKHIEKPNKPKYHFAVATPVVADAVVTEEITVTETVELKGIKIYARTTKKVVKTVLYRGNLFRPVCHVLLGKHHRIWHRMLVGVGVAVVGVGVAKYFGHSHIPAIAFAGDGIGFGLHALGCVPFIDWAIEHFEE